MIEVLNDTILEHNLTIKEGDFLKSNVEKDIETYFGKQNVCLIANLPYYITSPILLKLLEEVPSVKDIVIMIQKEVADRFVAKPNTKDYNALSVLIQYFTNPKYLFTVKLACTLTSLAGIVNVYVSGLSTCSTLSIFKLSIT